MIKRFAAAALAITIGALSSPTFANELNAADECVSNAISDYFNHVARIQAKPSVKLITYGNLEEIVSSCEVETNSTRKFFKGMKSYVETRGNITLDLN